jgi:hypothetical protein
MKFCFGILLKTISESEACITYKLHFQTKFTLNFDDHLKNGALYMKIVQIQNIKVKVTS